MKSQDIFILLKLVSLQQLEKDLISWHSESELLLHGWEGWDIDEENTDTGLDPSELISLSQAEKYTARGLSASLGVSKTEVNNSIKRSIAVGMAMLDRKTNYPKTNTKALLEFIVHGLKYVFPAKPAEIIRGIPTSFAAPVLEGQLMTAGEFIYVWPDARGKSKGQSVRPLFSSVPAAVKKDHVLYGYLALVDAIRLGSPREAKLAEQLLGERLRGR